MAAQGMEKDTGEKATKAAGAKKAARKPKAGAGEGVKLSRKDVHLLHQVVRWQRAKKRAGTHSTQTRAEMTGGGKKPWKQKGTGNARAGSNTSPLWVGGGIAHGPKPRDYEFRMNKKERAKALRTVIAVRKSEGKLFVTSDLSMSAFKTKEALKTLKSLSVPAGEKTLVVIAEPNLKVEKSFGNIAGLKVVRLSGLNVYDIVNAKNVVMSQEAATAFEKRGETN